MTSKLELPRGIPEDQGISSAAIADFVAEAENKIHYLHSFMLLRHGQVVAEGWWYPWRAAAPHMLYSLSKSFTATAVGFACADGRLSLKDSILSLFPEDAPKKINQNLAEMKIHHLLTMTTGHDQDTTEAVFSSRSPIKRFLAFPVDHVPGTYFLYNTGASFLLAAIVQKLTGQTLVEYLTPRLFLPLGIVQPSWESHPSGVNYGGMGLNLTTEDIARFGQLYLRKGMWNGQRILPEWWVNEATAKQVSNGDDPNSDWAQGYGYQFWRCRHNMYRGDGAFGQFCVIMPDQDAVLAITAGVPDLQPVLNLVWEKLLPAFESHAVPGSDLQITSLTQILQNLRIDPAEGIGVSSLAAEISGKTYTFKSNYETLHTLGFSFDQEGGSMHYQLLGGGKRRGKHQLEFKYGSWKEGTSFLNSITAQKVAVSGAWITRDTFRLIVCQYETPFIITITCRFTRAKLYYDCLQNVAFGPITRPQLIGHLE